MPTIGFLLVAVLALGCHNRKGDGKPGADADANSGPDANRSAATPILPNKVYTDRVDIGAGDMTDWKSIELMGKPGPLEVDLRWDNQQADVAVDAFDPKGTQIGSSPQNGGTSRKKLIVPIETLGIYYLRVTALTPKQGSDYTLETQWEGGDAPAPPPPVVRAADDKPKATTRKADSKRLPKTTREDASGWLQGRIVSARREAEGMVLFIDKGRAAGVAEGQKGRILEGPSGASPLDGGSFTITSVVDENRSIGKTSMRTIGKNNRVSINTGK